MLTFDLLLSVIINSCLFCCTASSMTSWSYQSTNPCTVLVKEKQDGSISRDCPPPILQSSSTVTAASSQNQPDNPSLGNSVGGKKARVKRQAHENGVVDVVFDEDDGHEDEPLFEAVEKRILVNITIGMDKGLGSLHQEIYQLQVAIPLPKEDMRQQKFYSYDVEGSIKKLNETPTTSTMTEVDDLTSTLDDDHHFSSDPFGDDDESSTTSFDEFITLSTRPEGLKN